MSKIPVICFYFKYIFTHDITVNKPNKTIITIMPIKLKRSANTTLKHTNSPRKKKKTLNDLSKADIDSIVITIEVYELKKSAI